VDPVLERRAVLDEVQPKAGELALGADLGVGQPDRRHRVAVGEHRQDQRVDPVGLAGQRRHALDPVGGGDLDRPALLLEGVVDEPGAGHRLDDGADGLSVDLLDPAREGSQRVGVGRDGELVEMLSLIAQQADVNFLSTEIESQRATVERASSVLVGW
jgi:hypothetical protein